MHEGLGFTTSLFGSSFFLLTGFHGTHVAVGVVWLLSLYFTSKNGGLTQGRRAEGGHDGPLLALRGRDLDHHLHGRLPVCVRLRGESGVT